ncbi:MAG: murein biosynthesis integral membrane protein MurJ, partial [Variibacter sp.]
MVVPRWPQWDADIRRFFKALVPATVGSAGVQLALFADTIIASFLTVGAVSALYYADRLNQLPIGVIGIAAGTVVLPEMARRIAAGDERGARHAQDRAIEMTVALAIPFVVGFVIVPDLVMRALFTRGAFTAADAAASAATLRAYALGLLPFVLIRSLVATFFARGDTATPVKASLTAAAVNIALKVALMGTLAQVGLALATSVGAWINVALVLWFALRRRLIVLDAALLRPLARLMAAGAVLAAVIWSAHAVLDAYLDLVRWKDQAMLAALAFVGAIVYGTALLFLYRARWRGVSPAALRR